MASTEEVLKALQNAKITTLAATEPEELVIDAESRTITVPSSERLFGVTGDMNIERKYFRCPKIVGDNVDLSTHQIFIAYVYTETESGSIFPSIGVAPYHCEDVEIDGEDITFSWKLTGNVFKNPGFILFKMYAKKTETDPNTVFNTTPAIGTVLATIPDGTEEIVEEHPDVIAQIFDRLDALESVGGGGTGGTTNYENLSNKPQLNGVTLEGNKTLDQVGVLAKNQGASNSGKFLSVGSDGNVVPADAPSGGTVDPEQIKQAVNGYLEENPPSGMTSEQKEQLGKVWIENNPSYTIAENKAQIFDIVENGKADKVTITDGSDYWDGEPQVSYPGTLNVKTLRGNRFYANMWLPNGMDMDQSYRYAEDKNGQIRLYDILNQKSDLTGLSPWGICLKGEGKSFPTGQCHFIISKIRVLGLDSSSGKWKLVKTCKPIAALFDIAQTSSEGTFVDVDRTVLSDDMFMFSIRQPTSWTMNGDMCFHFYPENTDAVTKEDIQDCSRILIAFRIRVQEAENSEIFTCSCGCDALGGTGVEAFFSRFNAVTDTLQELSSNNCLESESNILTDNLEAINELIYKEESVVSDEQVKGAVDSYLKENPVSGMTAEQEQQLNQNTQDVADLKSALEQIEGGGWSSTQIDLFEAFTNVIAYTSPDANSIVSSLISSLRSGSSDIPEGSFSIIYVLSNVTSSSKDNSIKSGESYNTTLTASPGYELSSVIVKMGGSDITKSVYSDGDITISAVTGNIVITASAVQSSASGQLPQDGLVDYFDFRNKSYTAGGGGLYYINSDYGNGMLYSWSNQSSKQGDDIGIKGAGGSYTSERATSYPITDNFPSTRTVCLFGKGGPSVPNSIGSDSTLNNSFLYQIKYIATDKTTKKLMNESIQYPEGFSKNGYNASFVIVNQNVLKIYFDDTLHKTVDGNEIEDFESWDITPLALTSFSNYGTAYAIYNKELSEVEIVEALEFFKTLEVSE